MSGILGDRVNKILYGGDYNPEQWDMDTRDKDMELFEEASIDTVTINVFSWALLQKDENTYDFTQLDSIVKQVTDANMNICMATSTAAHPAWMARKYPDVLRVDENGMRRKYGKRHNSCPNSPTFRKYSTMLAGMLAQRYKDQKNIVAWHVNNEYGGMCYCENCENAFRDWIKDKYKTIEELNYAWNTAFWGHTIYDYEDIVAPSKINECDNYFTDKTCAPSLMTDYRRFMSDSMMNNYIDESDAIKKIIPDALVTTNFMFLFKGLNYREWAKHMDMVSWDSYPQNDTEPALVAFWHDVMRGLKGGKAFMLMEQTPTVSGYLPINTMKRPGVMRLLSYQSVAHGADTVMFFQMRQSPAGCEMYHGAVIDHSGRNDTRAFIECKELGKELKKLKDVTLGGKIASKVAMYFDWECWWSLEEIQGISDNISYIDEVFDYYRALYEMNIPVDIIGTEDSIDKYDLVIAPFMYMIDEEMPDRLKEYVRNGGVLLTTLLSAHVSKNSRVITGGFPGNLMDLTGVWNEEIVMITEDEENHFSYDGKRYPAKIACSVLNCESAVGVCSYEEDYYKNKPVITRNSYGSGMVYYVGTISSHDFYRRLIRNICAESGIKDSTGARLSEHSADKPCTLEITVRDNEQGQLMYVLNHTDTYETIVFNEECMNVLSGRTYLEGTEIVVEGKQTMIFKTIQKADAKNE